MKTIIIVFPVVCPEPQLNPNCRIQSDYSTQYYYLHKIKFACNNGYHMSGAAFAVCGKDGRWSHDAPYCRKRK